MLGRWAVFHITCTLIVNICGMSRVCPVLHYITLYYIKNKHHCNWILFPALMLRTGACANAALLYLLTHSNVNRYLALHHRNKLNTSAWLFRDGHIGRPGEVEHGHIDIIYQRYIISRTVFLAAIDIFHELINYKQNRCNWEARRHAGAIWWSAPLRSNGADYILLLLFLYYFFIFFLFTVRSQKLLDRFWPNFQDLCNLL